jgi:transposase
MIGLKEHPYIYYNQILKNKEKKMKRIKRIIAVGIDVSKDKLDVSIYDGKNHITKIYTNKEEGIENLIRDSKEASKKIIDSELHFVMEATGTYHTKVLFTLTNNNYPVYVLNPLISKRYSEEQLRRTSTDKIASKLLAEYAYSSISSHLLGIQNERYNILVSSKFDKSNEDRLNLKILLRTLEGLKKTKTRILNQLEALNQYPDQLGIDAIKSLKSILEEIDKEIKNLENKISEIVKKEENRNLYEKLKTIPGIGDRAASAIIAYFGSFSSFDSPKQAPSYAGLTPLIKKSGKSVGAKEIYHISKIGSPYLRQILFMASLSAARYNDQCHILYERLLKEGKAKKLIYVAISCKLLRQTFGIIKNGRVYDPNFGLMDVEKGNNSNNNDNESIKDNKVNIPFPKNPCLYNPLINKQGTSRCVTGF